MLLYDSKHLVTHGVCVGMTGSGKTGLCIAALEEAAIDGIPSIVIDPKGDLANLLLTFPLLRPEDFAPWINEDDARKGPFSPGLCCPASRAMEKRAQLWKEGENVLADFVRPLTLLSTHPAALPATGFYFEVVLCSATGDY